MRKSFARPLVLVTRRPRRCELPRPRSGPSPRSRRRSAAPASQGREHRSRSTSGSPVSGFAATSRASAVSSIRAPVSSRSSCAGATVRATRSVDGRRLERLAGSTRDPRCAEDQLPLSDPALVRRAEAAGGGEQARACGRHPSRLEQASPLRRSEARAHLRRRDRPGGVPDPDGQLRDRDDAAEPVVVSPSVRLGRRLRSGPARARKSPGNALDGDLRAVRRHPRHAGRRLDRLLGLARLHSHANLRCRMALPARGGRNAGLHRLEAK